MGNDTLERQRETLGKYYEKMIATVEADANNLNVLTLALMTMRHKPKVGQSLLSSNSATQRQALVERWLRASSDPGAIWRTQALNFLLIVAMLSGVAAFWHS